MSVNQQLNGAGLNETQREVIKGAYGLSKSRKRSTAIQLAVSLRITTELVKTCEAQGLLLLKSSDTFPAWLETRAETTDKPVGERSLLKALDKTDIKDPKPFLFGEKHDGATTDTTRSTDGSAGSDSKKDSGNEPSSKSATDSVGADDASDGGSGSEGSPSGDGERHSAVLEGMDSSDTAGREPSGNSKKIRVVIGYNLHTFQSELDRIAALGKSSSIVTTSSFDPSTHRQVFMGFVSFGLDYGFKIGKRSFKTFLSHRANDLEDQVNEYLNVGAPKSVNLSISGHYNTSRSSHEFLVTISHL